MHIYMYTYIYVYLSISEISTAGEVDIVSQQLSTLQGTGAPIHAFFDIKDTEDSNTVKVC